MADKKKAPVGKAPAVLRTIALAQQQKMMLSTTTPPQFIKTKPGRGGKAIKYVEGGYVVSQLNAIFGPLNWSWKEVSRERTNRQTERKTEGEVTVRGGLTVHDHINGYSVCKEADGQHPIHENVPIGDAYKAANTDALKKAASMFGIAMDVYWGLYESVENQTETKASPKKGGMTIFEATQASIKNTSNLDVLRQLKDRIIDESGTFKQSEKEALIKQINGKLGTEA